MIVYFDRLGRILNNGAVLEISEMSRVIKLEILQLFASPLEQNWSKVDDIHFPLAGRDSAIFSKFYSKNTQRQLTMCIQLFTKYNYSTKSITNFDWLVCIHFSCTLVFLVCACCWMQLNDDVRFNLDNFPQCGRFKWQIFSRCVITSSLATHSGFLPERVNKNSYGCHFNDTFFTTFQLIIAVFLYDRKFIINTRPTRTFKMVD